MLKKHDKIVNQAPTNSLELRFTQKQFLKFNILFFLWVGLPLFGVGGFNWFIDPYGIYNRNIMIDGLNHDKPNKEHNDRLYKAIDIIRLKPNTILLGSSRVKRGLDPEHPSLKSFPVYNLGLNGANVYELRRYLEHTIFNNKKIDRVILGLDFFMFNDSLENQPSFTEYRLEKKHISFQDFLNTTLSLDTLFSGQETIQSSSRNRSISNVSENGFLPNSDLENENIKLKFEKSTKLYFKLHSDYKLSQTYVNELKKIVALCEENDIDLIVYFSPSHAIRLASIDAGGHWSSFEDLKRQVTELMPVWDFANHNSITTEPLRNRMSNYADESHYTKPVGDLILNRVLSYNEEKVPRDFGILLTSDNVNKILEKNRLYRDNWADKNPQEIEFVKAIQADMKDSSREN